MELTVTCVWVKGPYPYTAEYVIRLRKMVARHLTRPHRFVCLTDAPEALPLNLETVRIPSMASLVPRNGVGYWNKLRLFDPRMNWYGRMLYIDLDSIVVAPLDPIVDFPASLALTTDAFVVERAHLDRDRFNRRLVRRFNSSVIVWDGGLHTDLWTRWTPAIAEQLSTDQDWIGEQAEHAVGMPLAWFPRAGRLPPIDTPHGVGLDIPTNAIVLFVKKPKGHAAVEKWPGLEPLWGGWAA